MCGRYALNENARELADHFRLIALPEIAPRFNIAPGSAVPCIIASADGPAMMPMAWGLQPAWTHREGAPDYPKPINARAETVSERPMFREAFRRRRCILPASGFYEWFRPPSGPKQPFFIRPANEPVFAMAGLFETGRDGGSGSCCILTVAGNAVMSPIHDRMPVMLPRDAFDRWLDSATEAESLKSLLCSAPPEWTVAYRVSPKVNNARNDTPDLMEPIDPPPLSEN